MNIKLLKWSGALTYISLLFYIFFLARRRRHITHRYHNLKPVKKTLNDFYNITNSYEAYGFYVNVIGNILLFIPLPIILIFIFKVPGTIPVLFSLVFISSCIEVIQYVFSVGYADIDDILLNTLGAIIGLLICRFIQSGVPRRLYNQLYRR